jgi:hypothetical protein
MYSARMPRPRSSIRIISVSSPLARAIWSQMSKPQSVITSEPVGIDGIVVIHRRLQVGQLAVRIRSYAHTARQLLVDQGHGENVSASGLERARDLGERQLWPQDVLEHVLRHVQIDAGVGKRQPLEILAAKGPHHRSGPLILEELAWNVSPAFPLQAAADAAIAGRGFVNRQLAPARKALLQHRHQRALAWDAVATDALVMIAKPGIERDERGAALTDGTVAAITQDRGAETLPQPHTQLATFPPNPFAPALG